MKFIGLGFASILLFTTSSLYGHCGGCGVGGKTENKKCSEVNLVKAKKEKTEHNREMANLVGEQNNLFTKMQELLASKDMKGLIPLAEKYLVNQSKIEELKGHKHQCSV